MTSKLREEICTTGLSLFQRGYAFGSAGNISARLPDGGWLMTPTNVSMGMLDPAALSVLDEHGRHIGGPKPTKETFLHFAMYNNRTDAGAVLHLHSTHSVAVSMLDSINEHSVLPPLTPYSIMRLGDVRLIPFYPPGDERLGEIVAGVAARHHAILLANHGPVVAGADLKTVQFASEELEETSRLFLLLQGHKYRQLDPVQVADIKARFGV